MWNYRVVRKKNAYIDPTSKKEEIGYTYAIHEAFYDGSGHVGAITQDPVEPFGENVEEHRRQVDEERLEKEALHTNTFIGTATLEELIKKIYSDKHPF